MSILLYGVGAAAFVAGAVMIGFGVPINEFSFGNTLIVSGTTAAIGGLVVVGLGAAVSNLQRIADALATRAPIRSSRPFDTFDPAVGAGAPAAPARVPFPPKIKTEPKTEVSQREPHPSGPPMEAPPPPATPLQDRASDYSAPTLPNPDEPPVTVEDEISLSPRQPIAAPAADVSTFEPPARYAPPSSSSRAEEPGMDEPRPEPSARGASRHPPSTAAPAPRPQNTYFDAMWPAEGKAADSKSSEPKPGKIGPADENASEPGFNWPRREAAAPPAKSDQPLEFAPPPADEPRAVAILKSGVVDGMGYTLYVDGSIEAELPQGTLRFASINELRSHLEKTS
jgi:hypothetical protein